MNNDDFFTQIDEQFEENINMIEEQEENPFVQGLPNWDLEPPYETIRRNEEL